MDVDSEHNFYDKYLEIWVAEVPQTRLTGLSTSIFSEY